MTESTDSAAAALVRQRLAGLGAAETFVVYDLEYTAWEGSLARRWSGEGEYRELVQVAAVKLANQPGYPEVARFEQLSLPTFNSKLSAYFTGLTGISNADLAAGGRPFAVVIEDFARFIGDASIVAANGDDALCLAENCDWRGLDLPIADDRWLNLRPLFMTILGLPRDETISSDLPEKFGIAMAGSAHTGLGDARAIAQALRAASGQWHLGSWSPGVSVA